MTDETQPRHARRTPRQTTQDAADTEARFRALEVAVHNIRIEMDAMVADLTILAARLNERRH